MANGPFLGSSSPGILVLLGPRIRFRVTPRASRNVVVEELTWPRSLSDQEPSYETQSRLPLTMSAAFASSIVRRSSLSAIRQMSMATFTSAHYRSKRESLDRAATIEDVRLCEAQGSSIYWRAWPKAAIRFRPRPSLHSSSLGAFRFASIVTHRHAESRNRPLKCAAQTAFRYGGDGSAYCAVCHWRLFFLRPDSLSLFGPNARVVERIRIRKSVAKVEPDLAVVVVLRDGLRVLRAEPASESLHRIPTRCRRRDRPRLTLRSSASRQERRRS
jgi:hypothetical protein